VTRKLGFDSWYGQRIFSSLQLSDHLWGALSLVFDEKQGLFPRYQSGRSMKVKIKLQLAPRLRMSGSIPQEEVERDLQVLGVRRWRQLVADRKKMEGRCSTGQSPQWAVVPME